MTNPYKADLYEGLTEVVASFRTISLDLALKLELLKKVVHPADDVAARDLFVSTAEGLVEATRDGQILASRLQEQAASVAHTRRAVQRAALLRILSLLETATPPEVSMLVDAYLTLPGPYEDQPPVTEPPDVEGEG